MPIVWKTRNKAKIAILKGKKAKMTNREGEFSILNYRYKTPQDVVETTRLLGEHLMRPGSHGYKDYGPVPILSAARQQAKKFLEGMQNANVPIAIMDVVLAANRNYEKQVQPHIRRMKTDFPSLSLTELNELLTAHDYQSFKTVWGHADEKKFNTLKALVAQLLAMKRRNREDEYALLHQWAVQADCENQKNDPLGSIKNVGLATFQHLRIRFGVDTVKPDQRVREVLEREYGAKLSQTHAIRAVEQIAAITKLKVIEVDQIFVKYGSGYY